MISIKRAMFIGKSPPGLPRKADASIKNAARLFAERRGAELRRRGLVERDRQRLAPLLRVDDLHRHRLAFGETADAGGRQNGNMDEYVLAAIVGLHEAKAFGLVEPFDLAVHGHRGGRIGSRSARTRTVEAAAAKAAATGRGGGRAVGGARQIDLEDARDLLTLD